MPSKQIEDKLAELPRSPGVYFHKDANGEILYVGKAANLRNRVRQYFQKSRFVDSKTEALIAQIVDIDWVTVETEVDALFLEAELVRRYHPRFNILLRDDKSLQYVRIDIKSDYPTVKLVRRPLDDGAEYFGPYFHGLAIKRALKYLRRAFPYATNRPVATKRVSLHYHLGLDPGLEEGRTSIEDYRANLRKLIQYLRGNRVALVRELEVDMKAAAKSKDFEQAAIFRNQVYSLRELSKQIIFSDREFMDLSKDQGLAGLCSLLGMQKPPRRIEGFDISHMQGTDNAASMVVFSSGLPDKANYRKFKLRIPGNDDFAHMNEALSRRLATRNKLSWGVPDLLLIDGGRGQLSAAIKARDEADCANIPTIGLAKREEEIVLSRASSLPGVNLAICLAEAKSMGAYIKETADFISITLPSDSPVVKLLQRIRDESHRFAVSYHSTLKRTRSVSSQLDEIPGIGPATRKKLIRQFGSAKGVLGATQSELQEVLGERRGAALAALLVQNKTKESREK